jgi:hypothetical protein
MTMPALPRLAPPLATDAATATGQAGPCSLCAHVILRGERYALLVHTGKAAHLPCIGLMAARYRLRVPAIR